MARIICAVGRMNYIMNDKKICVLGGDRRQISVVERLKNEGYNISVFGLDGFDCETEKSQSLDLAIENAAVCVLPLPLSTDGIWLNCPMSDQDIKLEELIKRLEYGQIVAGGKISEKNKMAMINKGCRVFDYCDSERFNILNAVPTAEGAVEIAMNNMNTTVSGSKSAVFGFGRIGRVLCRMLKVWGSEVTVFARSDTALAWAKAEGYKALKIDQAVEYAGHFDVLFNTVPVMLIGYGILRETKAGVCLIDLASSPGGIDFECARALNKKVNWALSLPGKTAPITAGNIIAECILEYYKGVS